MNELISVVILNYNGINYLGDCLRSVMKQDYPSFEVIVVDNNSSDGSAAFVRENFPKARVIVNARNEGFAGGNNAGVREAAGKYVVLLNNDTTVETTWLSELYKTSKATGSPLLSSFIIHEGLDSDRYSQRGAINLAGYYIYNVFSDPTTVFYASGCAMFFDKDIVGLPFDPDFFFYSEDVYASWLTRLRGYDIRQAARSMVYHVGSATAGRARSFKRSFYQERNRLLNPLLFFSLPTLAKILPFLFLDALTRPLYALFNPAKSLPGWLAAMGWLLAHPKVIAGKRRAVQAQRKAGDASILKYMSCLLANGGNIFVRAANRLSVLYCSLAGLGTAEIAGRPG